MRFARRGGGIHVNSRWKRRWVTLSASKLRLEIRHAPGKVVDYYININLDCKVSLPVKETSKSLLSLGQVGGYYSYRYSRTAGTTRAHKARTHARTH
jgi:hypothetical protein